MSNGFFVKDQGLIAVDCGSELGRDLFLEVCAENNIAPADIRLLVVSHGHVDHFVNMDEMKTATGAPIMCHKNAERSLREAIYPDVRPRNLLGDYIISQRDPEQNPVPVLHPMEPDLVVEGTVDLRPWGIAGRLVETFGHSDSCMSLILDSGQAIVGDLLVEDPRDGSASVAYFCCSDDIAAVNEQVFASVEYLLDNAHIFYSGHGGPFTRDEIVTALAAARAEASSVADGKYAEAIRKEESV
jgi:glyoxylase-like metal-dependent hydrolase (beta-lactamase superfamily II)